MNKVQKREGFTIIEVVLVLAIAGLIFLIVFLAVPALQRSQRDTQRKNDLSRFMSQISSYQSNNKGAVPPATAAGITAAGAFIPTYLKAGGDSFTDPGGTDYGTAPLTITYAAGTPSSEGNIIYMAPGRCGANGSVSAPAGTGARQVAASIGLEGGGAYCQQN